MEKVIIVGQRLRWIDRGDLCRAREPESARARRPPAWRPTFHHDAGGKFPRLSRRHRWPATDHEHARAGGKIRCALCLFRGDRFRRPQPDHIRIKADDEWLETRALIIASGASARWLGLENEEKLVGHGLTSCATCDGAFYRNVPVCVIGGGDSAAEEALFLTRFASKVYLIHRRDKLRASKIMADRVLACEKIEPIWNTVVTRYIPDEKGEMRAVMLRNVETHEERELPVACVFVAIGHDPNTKAFQGKLETDPDGYLLVRHLAESKHPAFSSRGTWRIAFTSRRSPPPAPAAPRRWRRRSI